MSIEFALPESVGAILRPPEELLPHAWVERYRWLTDKDAGQPGPFRFDGTPYFIEPTDALVDPTVGTCTVIKASRCGGSELLKNILAFSIDARPMPAIYVLPREEDVKEEFSGALRRMAETTPKLAAHRVLGNWASDNALLFDTMTVLAGKASTPADFLRRTSGLNLFDEVDNCEDQAKTARLGSIWTLLLERITTFLHLGKQYGVSTPTLADAAAWLAYEKSDRRRYWCPCPFCGVYQVPRFDLIRLIPGHEDERNPDLIENLQLARLRCEHPDCGGLVADGDKLWMTQRGIWVPACQTIGGRLNVDDAKEVAAAHFRIPNKDRFLPPIAGEKPITRNRGYWVDATVSPWRTFSQFLAKFFATKDTPRDYRVFHNQWKALPWKESSQSAEPNDLASRVEIGPPPDLVPAKATLLLGYADVQGYPMIRYTFAAFGPGEECWVVKTGTCDSFEAFEALAFDTAWPYADDETQTLACRAVGYDTGYKTSMVYERHRARPAEVFLTKGWETLDEKYKPARVEYHPSGKKNPVGVRLFHLNTGFYKEKIFGTYEKPPGGPGTLHLHREHTRGQLEELTSEHYVYRKGKKKSKGRWAWEVKVEGRANHDLDKLVGLFFLADHFNARLLPTRETVQKAAARAHDKTDRPTGGGYRKPDGRPWISGR